MHLPVSIDVIERQELGSRFTATGAGTAVCGQHRCAELPVIIPGVRTIPTPVLLKVRVLVDSVAGMTDLVVPAPLRERPRGIRQGFLAVTTDHGY
jgi:hypothetical protein